MALIQTNDAILVLGPTVFSKGKENLDINEPAKCFKVRMEEEKRKEKRTMATQLRVVCWPNANVLQAACSKQGCGSATKVS